MGRQLTIQAELKKKARILIPDAAVLMGVIDEDGYLEEDEVFVQLKRDNFKPINQKDPILMLIDIINGIS